MTSARCRVALAAWLLAIAIASSAAQSTVTTTELTAPEMETFLRTARIVSRKPVGQGVTDSIRVTLTNGRVTHDAQIQTVDIYQPVFQVDPKHSEVNFRDTYRYNIAAYRLGHLLALNIPMSVPRRVDGKPAAITWWIDNVAMDEQGRQKLPNPLGPNAPRTNLFMYTTQIFDELIQNRDRNMGNLVWTTDWTLWMVDHTRAFRLDKKLMKPEALQICERNLFTGMQRLTRDAVAKAVGDSLLKVEIDALMIRRDAIVALLNTRISQKGEASVIVPMPTNR